MLHVRQQSRPLLVVVGHTCSKPLLLVFNPHNPAPSSRSFLLHIDVHCINCSCTEGSHIVILDLGE